jgi:serine/threonine protein kinase
LAQDEPHGSRATPVSRTSRGDDPLLGAVVSDKYRVHSLVARGGMGRIYRAEQVPLGRVVALKVLTPRYATDSDPQVQKRFLREAATCAKLTHPNTVTVFDYGHFNVNGEESFFMVMEFVEGRTLARAIKEEGPIQPVRALKIAREICRSLKEAHKLGIVHRDLKPSNVMLTWGDEGEACKVLDFGIAKTLQEGAAAENLTLEGNFLGSPRYMAPEQIRHLEVDGRADIYALGVVLFEMLTARAPFEGDAPVKTLMQHLTEPVPSMKKLSGVDVPAEVEQVVRKCMMKDPAERWPDVDALREALKDAAAHLGEVTGEHTGDRSGQGKVPASLSTPARREPSASLDATMTAPVPSRGVPWLAVAGVLGLLFLVLAGLGTAFVVGQLGSGEQPEGEATVVVPATPPEPEPPAEPPPAAKAAVLTLDSEPQGAEIWEGNKLHGKTPLPIPLDVEGERTFTLKLKGYEDLNVVQGAAEADLTLKPELKKKAVIKPKVPPKKPKPTADDIRSER